jgi:hypothetical protein
MYKKQKSYKTNDHKKSMINNKIHIHYNYRLIEEDIKKGNNNGYKCC